MNEIKNANPSSVEGLDLIDMDRGAGYHKHGLALKCRVSE